MDKTKCLRCEEPLAKGYDVTRVSKKMKPNKVTRKKKELESKLHPIAEEMKERSMPAQFGVAGMGI